jgi:hypothetical protein
MAFAKKRALARIISKLLAKLLYVKLRPSELASGEVTEWIMVPLSKSGLRLYRSVGSNPTLSAERCWSGLTGTPGERVSGFARPWVRIPPSPPTTSASGCSRMMRWSIDLSTQNLVVLPPRSPQSNLRFCVTPTSVSTVSSLCLTLSGDAGDGSAALGNKPICCLSAVSTRG